MQNSYPHSSPNRTQHAGLFESSTVNSTNPTPPSAIGGPQHRGSHGLKIPHLLYNPPSQDLNQQPLNSSYQHSYDRNPSGPTEQRPSIHSQRSNESAASESSLNAVNHMMSAGQPPQKRAYRQRRKDPSCDACRERKVKCDASDSSSCTECSNRNVRCLFTKETNRRMSSIKQVQDLERQLAQARQQLTQLRSGIPKIDSLMDVDYSVGDDMPRIPEIGYRSSRLFTPNFNHNLTSACSKMRLHGHGLINFPHTPTFVRPQVMLTTDTPVLPPSSVIEALFRPYYSCVHSVFPLFHWPTFSKDYDRVRRANSFRGMPRGWTAVFFSVLACGSLHSMDPDLISRGKEFLQTCVNLIDLWQDGFTMEQVQAALLISFFLYEFNLKSASWVWLGSAVRIAQDIGLHAQNGPWPALDAEVRKRLWWSLYSWERIIVLELGRPLFIHDDDCDVDLPSPADEHLIQDGVLPPPDQGTSPLLAVIHITRAISQLTRTLRAPVISSDTLEVFERHFRMCLATFPPEYRMKTDLYLAPRYLSPIIYLQNTRLLLHRRNLSPTCSPEMRHLALDQCLAVAQDTTRILLRCMRPPSEADSTPANPQSSDWRYNLAAAASTVLSTHIWRCLLFLLFRAEYSAAVVCIQACSAIGDSRAVNICAGRYINFFLRCLLEKRQRNDASSLERDEEIMAYVSGDFQSRIEGSWVWRNSDIQSPASEMSPRSTTSPPNPSPGGGDTSTKSCRAPETEPEWEGWEWIEKTVEYLLTEQKRNTAAAAAVPERAEPLTTMSASSDSARTELTPTQGPDRATNNRSQASSSSRMTIANII